jgi:polyphosphate:AMP phosphotransferase
MFESYETGRKVEKSEFEERAATLRPALLNAQFDSRTAGFPIVVLLSGNDRAGGNEMLDLFHEWLDARGFDTSVFRDVNDAERERPHFWRYWQALPARGRTGLLLTGWAGRRVYERGDGDLDDAEWEAHLRHVRALERELVADGTLLLKFWLHAPRKTLEKRFERADKDPDSEPYVEKTDEGVLKNWKGRWRAAEDLIRRTDTAWAPWRIVESSNRRARALDVFETLLSGLRWRLGMNSASGELAEPPAPQLPPLGTRRLQEVDLSATVAPEEYRERRRDLQGKLALLSRKARREKVATILVFEGWDAAGKGSAIRRLTQALAARDYAVTPIAAPTEDERRYHYLWRFWRAIPAAGHIRIFDRSWYGRVLVERVEGFATEAEWQRAYDEIRDFEEHLVEFGTVLEKFWLHISPEQQLARFQAREITPYKQHKITEEDWRNREKRPAYEAAVEEMIVRTGTSQAPWTVVSAEDKRHARLTVLETVVRALERAVG